MLKIVSRHADCSKAPNDCHASLLISKHMKSIYLKKLNIAHLERMAGGKATLYLIGLDLSYRPPSGFAAARMDVRAFKLACTTAKYYKGKPSRHCVPSSVMRSSWAAFER